MKDTITLAELRQTELYRREQTRPLREFLMENIDVLKLADEVEMWGEDLLALNMRGGIPVVQGAKMLRQQADRIKELEQAIKDADEWLESGEGVSLCYYSFSDSNPKSIKIIKEITG